jgi:UDP-3-O-[3-hydroxymyristoyl] glucosamine N-acyltransferase
VISGVASLREAAEHDLSLYVDRRYRDAVAATRAAVVLARSEKCPLPSHRLLVVRDPRAALRQVLTWLYPEPELVPGVQRNAEIHPTARIHTGARVDALATVGPGATIGARTHIASGARVGENAKIGDDTRIGENAVLGDGVRIGDRVRIGPGTVVGSMGFGFVRVGDAHWRVPHVGTVVIEDDVEIGANCAIDRATFGATRIRRGAKIDNLVQIAHNVVIGENVLIAAQCGISGSAVVGDGVMMGGQAGVSDHVVVAPGTRIAAKAGVMKSIGARRGSRGADDRSSEGMTFAGHPARPLIEQRRAEAALRRLDDQRRRVRELERRLAVLTRGDAERWTRP